MADPMTQEAPYPQALVDLVAQTSYRPGWQLELAHIDRGQGSKGLTLTITALVVDSRDPAGGKCRIAHLFPVPPAAYNERSWRHWLFDRLCEVELHEASEFFQLTDGDTTRRPFAPLHAPGNDPYMVVEATRDEEHTTNTGRVHP